MSRTRQTRSASFSPLRWAFCAIALATLVAPASRAEDEQASAAVDLPDFVDFNEISLEDMLGDPIVSTGSRRAHQVSRSLNAISVLTREDLRAYPNLYLGDFLAMIPGVDVRWGQMQRLHVAMRGLGGSGLNSRVLLLIDGIPQNDPMTGELSAGHFVPLAEIDRIEIIRGPGSSIYGANAFSGVVNVVTLGGGAEADRLALEARSLIGSDLTRRIEASYRQKMGDWRFGAAVDAFGTDGPFQPVTKPGTDARQTIDNDDVRSASISATAAWKGLRLQGSYTQGERGRPGQFPTDDHGHQIACDACHRAESPTGMGIKYPESKNSCGSCHLQPRDRQNVSQGRLALTFQHALSDSLRVGANGYHNEWRSEYDIFKETEFLGDFDERSLRLKQRSSGFEAHVQHDLEKVNSLVGGVELKRGEVASHLLLTPQGGNHSSQVDVGVFVEDEYTPLSWLTLVVGLRLDYNDLFDFAFSPRGGLIFPIGETGAVRLSAARAFRNPNFSELYLLDSRGRYAVMGNPDLSPEWNTSFEAGVHYVFQWPVVVTLSAAGFYTLADDLIAFRPTGPTEASFFNVESATLWGGEIQIGFETKERPQVAGFLNYAYQHTEDGHGRHLPYAPDNKINLGLRGSMGRFGMSVVARLIGERLDNEGIALPTHVTADVSARVELLEGFGVSLWLKNLADADFQESLGIPGMGRSFFAVLDYKYQSDEEEK